MEDRSHDPAAGDATAVGRSIGAWRITGVLGRGGMGAVYAVERADGAYAQRAALKLIRSGSDTPAARERFLRERQTLARLQHPHIATLLDGGFSGEGDPYFVMEQVDGVPIDRWCDERGLGLRQRVVLFLQVLDAVQYAHRNLVVHRDLKPSNLLVTAEGQAQLLDFGIARHLQDAGATAPGDRALTLEYAAPEQLHDAPITTATDLYQLGVVLYRLLCGAHPFGVDADTPVARQLQALSRDPQPVTRAARQVAQDIAAARGHAPRSLARALRGNLAAIVHACLRREPDTRYASAEALANDLRAWLDDRPVVAARLGRGERVRLWLRRNRVLAASAAAVFAALLAGTGVALWQAHEAREQARIAGRESANAREALAFLADTLGAAAPEQALSREVGVRELLDKARTQLDQRTAIDPQVRQPVQRMLGRLYQSMNDNQVAVQLFAEGLAGIEPARREEALALADDLVAYSDALGFLERNAEAFAVAEQAVALRTRFAPDDPEQQLRSLAHLTLGHVDRYGLEACRQRAEQALALSRRMQDPPVDVVLDIYSDLSTAANFQNDRSRQLSVSREGLAFADAHQVPADSPVRLTLLRGLVNGLLMEGKAGEAENVVRQALASAGKTGGFGGSSLSVLLQTLGETVLRQGRYREALEAMEGGAREAERAGDGPRNRAMTSSNRAVMQVLVGDYPAAMDLSDRAIDILRQEQVDADDVFGRTIERAHASVLMANRRFSEAGALLLDLRERARRLDGEDSEEYALLVGQQLILALRGNDQARGLPLLAEARARMAKRGVPETHEQFAHFLRFEAGFAWQRGDTVAAEGLQREALQRLESAASATDVAVARAQLAGYIAARGDAAQARRLLAEALPPMRAAVLPQEASRAEAEALARRLGM
nr:serine/threonine-protein kinase [Luteimonas saliphila]